MKNWVIPILLVLALGLLTKLFLRFVIWLIGLASFKAGVSPNPKATDSEADGLFDSCLKQWGYAGRTPIEILDPPIREVLELLKERFEGKMRIPDQSSARNHKFYIGYIESDEVNALAFCHRGFLFVGLTRGLISEAFSRANCVRNSAEVRKIVGVSKEQFAELGITLALLNLYFVITHEYAHHFLGHVGRDGTPFIEFGATRNDSITSQTDEIMADSIAINLILSVLYDGDLGRGLDSCLRLKGRGEARQKKVLTMLVITICDFLEGVPFAEGNKPIQVVN